MLRSHGAQHNRALMPEWDQGVPQPSLLLHQQTMAPRERASDGLSIKRSEILPRSKSNQTLPRGYVLTAKMRSDLELVGLAAPGCFL